MNGFIQIDVFHFPNRHTTNPIWIMVKCKNKVKRQHLFHVQNKLCTATEMGKIVAGTSDEKFFGSSSVLSSHQ